MNNNLSYLKEQEKFLCKMQGRNINCLSVHISKTYPNVLLMLKFLIYRCKKLTLIHASLLNPNSIKLLIHFMISILPSIK